MKLVLATANPDKAREISDVLRAAGSPVDLVPRPGEVPEVDETGTTLEENARLKAIALCAATGLPAIADDTGLEVDALDGAPGVLTARFAGVDASYADNVAHLLELIDGLESDRRTRRFTTVAHAYWPDGREVEAIGTVEGRIADEPRGELGFGYDPIFVPDDGNGRTFAEMAPAEKDALSHRGRAFRTLADGLRVVETLESER